ncbi:uncharacterized protein G2W53_040099 [Senna tora]|uniref:Uncharacterized protein n=1 Tax=Senna tora TaxID=362788 RepID=A0A834SNW2_9FABA|nr:uncharacterized protein G2W53_040099 [Senna tora]
MAASTSSGSRLQPMDPSIELVLLKITEDKVQTKTIFDCLVDENGVIEKKIKVLEAESFRRKI